MLHSPRAEVFQRLIHTGRARERPDRALVSRLAVPFAIGWLLIVAFLALLDAWRSVIADTLWAEVSGNLVTPEIERAGIVFNLIALGLGVALSIVVGVIWPAWWRRAMALAAALPVPALLITSHSVTAGMAVLALLLPPLWLGREVAPRLLPAAGRFDSWVLGGALGLGLIAATGLLLGVSGWLRPHVVWPLLGGVTVALLATARRRLCLDLTACGSWLAGSGGRRPLGLLLAGIGLAYFWLNLIGALTPETFPDAARQRTPTALAFATTGRLVTGDPDLYLGQNTPIAGEIIYAVALVLGPLQTAKLLQFAVSLLCCAAIFALARRLADSRAGQLAALAFWTMPLVVWLTQTAYLDLFITYFGVTAVLAIMLPERPDRRATVIAGICLGLGIAVKIAFGQVAVGVAVILGLASLRRGGMLAAARLVTLLTAVSLATATPWLARTYLVGGAVPGLAMSTQSLTKASGERPATVEYLAPFGYPRSWKNLLLTPLSITLESWKYGETPSPGGPFDGHIGYLLLALIPLAALVRRKPTLVVLAGAFAAFGVWFYVAQYLRYALPQLALLCVVAGVAFAAAQTTLGGRKARAMLATALLVLLAAGVSVQMRVPNPGYRYAFGREDKAQYLTRHLFCCSGYAALQLLDAEPGAPRVFAPRDPARLYTRARMSSPWTIGQSLMVEGDEALLLSRLREGGYTHLLIDRRKVPGNWDRLTVLDEGFLRRNTVLIGGGANTYLYRLLPAGRSGGTSAWPEGPELLTNGRFEIAAGGTPAGRDTVGYPRHDASGTASKDGRGAALVAPRDALVASVGVAPNVQYLLSQAARSAEGPGTVRLHIDWRDAAGETIGVADESVPVSSQAYHTFSMLATAPPGAATAIVRLQPVAGAVWFDDVSLHIR